MATVDDKKIIFSMVGLNKTIQQTSHRVAVYPETQSPRF